jgi:transposase-like protein
MATNNLNAPQFQDPDKARQYLEAQVWPNGPVCPHCGGTERIAKSKAKTHRAGLYHCGDCREQFTVTVGSLFERSKIPLNKWLLAVYLLCSSKKGMSAKQLERMLGVTYKSAWFMAHRIREAMKPNTAPLMGGGGQIVEADETFWGRKPGTVKRSGYAHKNPVVSLVERGGQVRSFHVADVKTGTIRDVLLANIDRSANLMTDEASAYVKVGGEFASHETVKHGKGEYSRGNVNTNTIEGYFSIFKRGMIGTYHKCGEQHLKRYAVEFDFRYNHRQSLGIDDVQRTEAALKGISGKRLTYRRTHAQK